MAMTLTEDGETVLTGPVADQAALYGLLRKVRDLGMPLLSVSCVAADQAGASATEEQNAINPSWSIQELK